MITAVSISISNLSDEYTRAPRIFPITCIPGFVVCKSNVDPSSIETNYREQRSVWPHHGFFRHIRTIVKAGRLRKKSRSVSCLSLVLSAFGFFRFCSRALGRGLWCWSVTACLVLISVVVRLNEAVNMVGMRSCTGRGFKVWARGG